MERGKYKQPIRKSTEIERFVLLFVGNLLGFGLESSPVLSCENMRQQFSVVHFPSA